VFVIGATGTIGQATVRALLQRGNEVVCFVRPRAGVKGKLTTEASQQLFEGATVRFGAVTDPVSLASDGFCGERFDVLVSCLASRTGSPRDAWAIDHQAHVQALAAARVAGVTQVVLLSAICVQKPLLAFQRAKLAFEKEQGQLVETLAATRTVFARARAERDAHMAWVQRTAPLLAAEVRADPRATFAALDRMMREHLEYLADMPLGSFGDGA
jgi:hypothetical protein